MIADRGRRHGCGLRTGAQKDRSIRPVRPGRIRRATAWIGYAETMDDGLTSSNEYGTIYTDSQENAFATNGSLGRQAALRG